MGMQNGSIPTRNEIPLSDTWDLSNLYENVDKWQEEWKELDLLLEKLQQYAGTLTNGPEQILSFLRLQDHAANLYERVLVYAGLSFHQDMGNSEAMARQVSAQEIGSRLSGAVAFFEPEILEIPETDIRKWVDSGQLSPYEKMIQDILRTRAHTLSAAEEVLLARSQEVASASSDVYGILNNADLSLGKATDEKDVEREITHGNFISCLQSEDRVLRENAFRSCYTAYGNLKNTLGALYLANVKQARFYSTARKYPSSLERALDGSHIPIDVYDSLIDAVHEALPAMYRYVALRKKLLGVEELHMYDVYVPIIPDCDEKVSFEEAKEIALAALAPMGEEYLSILREGFENRWIDIYENKGKRSGAYSWGAYGTHPYVLLNFQGTLDDVFTLVHEMGHAIHTYYTNETQPFVYSGYRIFVAEVASTCNEALLMQYLLKNTTDPAKKRFLINHFLDQFKGTVFRQTMFAEFEKITHSRYANGESLTPDDICKIYLELNEKYFGPDMVSDPEIAMEWARIPHFYTEFYVYQYATGFAAAIALSGKILAEGERAVEAYKSFLKGGSSKDPLELLRMAGVDLADPAPVRQALEMFAKLVCELEES